LAAGLYARRARRCVDPRLRHSPGRGGPMSEPASESLSAAARARTALAFALIALTALAFALIRVNSVNLPWHLATARLAEATGHWPAVNTFSYTFPDHPIFQQYPAFQWTVWNVYKVAGWSGLSVLTGVGWTIVFLLFVRWGGPWRAGMALLPF